MKREFGLDLIRGLAAVLVLTVHFFLNTPFYSEPLTGAGMAVSAVARMAAMTCVPLFLTLTGYLCIDRVWSKRYYRSLLPVLLTYLLAAAVCLVFQAAWLGKAFSPPDVIRRLLGFSAAPYGWYVEMYIGLFLLSPFLNAAWHALDERARLALVCTLVGMTALPPVTNLLGQILPDWWTGIYPMTYYVMGAWLREHPLTAKGPWLVLGWVGLAAASGLLRFGMARGGSFTWAAVSDWGSLFVAGETVCLFSLLSRCSGTRCPRSARWCVQQLARLSLPLYLTSYVADQLTYPHLLALGLTPGKRLLLLPVMVCVNALISLVLAQIVDWAVKLLLRRLPDRKRETVSV